MADVVEKRAEERPPSVLRPRSAYSKRFMLANLLVVAGFVGVLLLFGFLVSKDSSSKQAWSEYTPQGGDVYEKAQNMVDRVAPKYRYGGAPIAVVQAQPLLYRDALVDGIAFRRPPLREVGGRLDFEPSGSTITYVFCGQAQACSLPRSGAEDVGLLLQRESLELALYTFKYSPEVRSVVTLLPPDGNLSAAVFLKRRHVARFLDKPLAATLPPHEELTASSLTRAEREAIDRVIVNNTFASRFEQAPNGRTVLLLSAVNG